MTLQACRECSKTVSTEALSCPHCGTQNPTHHTAVVHQKIDTTTPRRATDKCPQCGSHEVRKASVLYEAGTKTTTGTAIGGTTEGSLGGAMLAGTEQSLLASRLKPPEPPSGEAFRYAALTVAIMIAAPLILAGIVLQGSLSEKTSLLIIGISIVSALIAGPIVFFVSLSKKTPAYQWALMQWQKRWYCMRCGYAFTV